MDKYLKNSSMRLMCFLCLLMALAAGILSFALLFMDDKVSESLHGIGIMGTFLTFAFGGKTFAKFQEKGAGANVINKIE